MDTPIKNCSAVILAGGENRRMPVLKAFIEIDGQKIIDRNIKILRQNFSEVSIITNQPELYTYLEVPMCGDIYNTRGPMTGIFTALLNSSSPWVFVSACDMPFIDQALMMHMISQRKGVDAVVPISKSKAEPLFAIYSKRLIRSFENSLLNGKKSLRDFLVNKRVKYIPSSEIREFDPIGLSFINLNTPQDIKQYLTLENRSSFKIRS